MKYINKVITFIKTTIIAVMLLSVSGCIFDKPPVYVKEYVGTYPAASLMLDCNTPTPPKKDDYLQLPQGDKEKALVGYSGDLIKSLGECNTRLKGIRDWKDKTKAELDALNEKAKKGE